MYGMEVKTLDGMFQVCTNVSVRACGKFPRELWLTRQGVQKLLDLTHSPVVIADCRSNTVPPGTAEIGSYILNR